jgi:hypothetical protein
MSNTATATAPSKAPTAADKLKDTLDAIGRCLTSQSSGQAAKLIEDAKHQVDQLAGSSSHAAAPDAPGSATAPPTPGVNTEHFAPGSTNPQPEQHAKKHGS